MCRELDEKGGDQVTPMLFVDVPKIEVEICHRGLAGTTHGFDILDDGGTGKRQATQLSLTTWKKGNGLRTRVYSCRSQLQIRIVISWHQAAEWNRCARFPWIQSSDSDPVDFHSLYNVPSKNQVAVPL